MMSPVKGYDWCGRQPGPRKNGLEALEKDGANAAKAIKAQEDSYLLPAPDSAE